MIYSAGFLSPGLMQMLELFDTLLDPECPCYHWGDRDVGGLRIFAHIESGYKRHNVLPHLMTVASDKELHFAKKERTTLEKVACEETEAGSLARTWLQHKLGPMEQEALDPLAPQK